MTPETSQTYVHQHNWTFIVMYHVCDNEKLLLLFLVSVMFCRLFGTKPLPEAMLTSCRSVRYIARESINMWICHVYTLCMKHLQLCSPFIPLGIQHTLRFLVTFFNKSDHFIYAQIIPGWESCRGKSQSFNGLLASWHHFRSNNTILKRYIRMRYTIDFRYIAARYNPILHTAQQLGRVHFGQTSHYRANYESLS